MTLKIYCFSQALFMSEMLSLLGDKYSHSLPFTVEIVDGPQNAQVFIWDGVVTAKNKKSVDQFLNESLRGVIVLASESKTLFFNHPMVKLSQLTHPKLIEVHGWSLLPEEMMAIFEECYQKLIHV